MDNNRTFQLLVNAISMLIDENITAVEIKNEIGATEEEWKEIMDLF